MKYIATIIFFLFSWNIAAQVNDTTDLRSPVNFSLIDSYYQDGSFLNHSYSYELGNRIKQLRMQKRNVVTFGFLATMGTIAYGAFLAEKYDWSLWVYIPCASVIGICETACFVSWALNLEKKAAALEQQTSYMLSMKGNIDLGLTRYGVRGQESVEGFGLAIKFNF